jgi:YVTN family beta-propeller protein
VLNKAEATASLIDLGTGAVAATLPTGQGPHEVAVSPDGRLALACNYGGQQPGSSLTLIDVPGAAVVKTIELGQHRRPHGVQWLPDGKRAAVTAEGSKSLLIVDVEAGTVTDALPTGQEVSHMVVLQPDGARAFVANLGSGSVTAFDLAAKQSAGTVQTGAGAEGIEITPDGRQLWVTNREADTISVLDPATLQIVKTLKSSSFPIRAAVTPDGRHVLVSNAKSGQLAVFDTASGQQVHTIAMAMEAVSEQDSLLNFGKSPVPIGIEVHPGGKRAYVANAAADAIAVVDLEQWKVIGTLKAGREPDGMAYSPLKPQR